jgi:hypothetical protein
MTEPLDLKGGNRRLGPINDALQALEMIEGTVKAYVSREWWEEFGVGLLETLRRGLATREFQETMATEGGGITEQEEFEAWWDDPEGGDRHYRSTAWAAWKAARGARS